MTSSARRILWLSNETPDRLGQGGQRRQYFQIAALVGAGVDVTVVTLKGPQSDSEVSRLASVQRTAPEVFARLPSIRHRLLVRRLAKMTWDGTVVAHTESWRTWQRLLRRLDTGTVLVDMHNVLSAWYRHQGLVDEERRWAQVEEDIFASGASVSVCSSSEATLLGNRRASILLPHGIDPGEWTVARAPRRRPVVNLFGNWAWAPNAAGLRWFLDDVWTRVDHADGWTCEIAGSGVPTTLPPGVLAVGRVPSISEFLADAAVVAVPVREGVGAPVKYAEALASGVPVIATSAGAPYPAPRPACVSDEAAEWVRVFRRILEASAEYDASARRVRDEALARLAWHVVSAPLIAWALGDPE